MSSMKFAYFHHTRIGRNIGVLAVAYVVTGTTLTYTTSFCTQGEVTLHPAGFSLTLADTFRKSISRDITRGRYSQRPDLRRAIDISTDEQYFVDIIRKDILSRGMAADNGISLRVRMYSDRDALWRTFQPKLLRRLA